MVTKPPPTQGVRVGQQSAQDAEPDTCARPRAAEFGLQNPGVDRSTELCRPDGNHPHRIAKDHIGHPEGGHVPQPRGHALAHVEPPKHQLFRVECGQEERGPHEHRLCLRGRHWPTRLGVNRVCVFPGVHVLSPSVHSHKKSLCKNNTNTKLEKVSRHNIAHTIVLDPLKIKTY